MIFQEPPYSASAILLNSVYFKADWEWPFSNELNTRGKFYTSENKSVDVLYMLGDLEDVPYFETKKYGCKMLAVPYKGDEMRMYIVLPEENTNYAHNIDAFINTLKVSDLQEMTSKLRKHDVIVKIPKVTLASTVSILESLKSAQQRPKEVALNFGRSAFPTNEVEEASAESKPIHFPSRAKEETEVALTDAAENDTLVISDIIQQMSFSINEKGTEAAAISAGILDYSGGAKNFLLTRPFFFFIQHEATSTVVFLGTISDPSRTS